MSDKPNTMDQTMSDTLITIATAIGNQSKANTAYHQQQLLAIQAASLPGEWKTLLVDLSRKLKTDAESNDELLQTVQTMINTITPLTNQIVKLTEANNQLVELQRAQNDTLNRLLDTFVENTSRMDVLTMVTADASKSEALIDLYKDLEPKDPVSKVKTKV